MTTVAWMPPSRGATITMGVLIALAGLALLVWPGATTVVLVTWLGLALVVYGVYEVITSLSAERGGSRVWGVIIAVIAILGGVVIFATPIVSTITVGLVIGWYWVIGGVIGVVVAIMVPGRRIVRLLVAGLSVVIGLIVISQPALALVTLVWFTGAWMLATGIIIVISAFLDNDRMLAT